MKFLICYADPTFKIAAIVVFWILKTLIKREKESDNAQWLADEEDEDDGDGSYISPLESYNHNQIKAVDNYPVSLVIPSVVDKNTSQKEPIHSISQNYVPYHSRRAKDVVSSQALLNQKLRRQAVIATKLGLKKKRKFFKSAILMHELMKRKYFIADDPL
ncbi:hypothetical protein [Cardinium endosymbiont of Culicoides punctatus]|uniref:hypothetical protein n=1 Tax=Cardinium endosymbiont of Culicoides punctatus TaxID=2304601 RepID=UPI001058B553|nr:hypothetical protein [Cardinium endosymbiont of Culicoides punctatus]TDG95672.1 hypothetical protein CCPUN_01320 [Cardinium endosymbiont of Culicoides punctatus]